MNTNLLFDFSINKENNTIRVQREFNAGLELVWKAWTTAELLNQWWGPKPCHIETKTMDFREGGYWHYAMIVPNTGTFWSRVNYITIVEERSFLSKDGFCDEHGEMDPAFSQNLWECTFEEVGDKTLVDILYTFDTLAGLEQTIAMNFKNGFTTGLQQLDGLLAKLSEK